MYRIRLRRRRRLCTYVILTCQYHILTCQYLIRTVSIWAYLHVSASILANGSLLLPPSPFARPRLLARWRVVATIPLRAGARTQRCCYGNFAVRAAQVQANNQQIYLDQARSTGQQQQEATRTAANLLRVEVPCRCWLPVVYLKATEKQYR
jgi:hypothetical protein